MICKLDWLSFTWKSGNTFNPNEFEDFLKVFPEVKNILVESIVIADGFGGHGGKGNFYDTILGFNDYMKVSYNITPLRGPQKDVNQGVNVAISAQGLEYFFTHLGYKLTQVTEVLKDLRDRGCQFSRLDFAFDDYTKKFSPKQFARWWTCDQIVTRYSKSNFITRKQNEGATFYLGDRSNGKLMRIYDKAFESKGQINAYRYEFEFHTKYTPPIVDFIIEHGEAPCFLQFLDTFIIDVVGIDENQKVKSRRATLPEWQEFKSSLTLSLTQSIKIRATAKAECANKMVKALRWYRSQVFPSLCATVKVLGWKKVLSLILSCKDKEKCDSLEYYYDTHKAEIIEIIKDQTWKDKIYKVS